MLRVPLRFKRTMENAFQINIHHILIKKLHSNAKCFKLFPIVKTFIVVVVKRNALWITYLRFLNIASHLQPSLVYCRTPKVDLGWVKLDISSSDHVSFEKRNHHLMFHFGRSSDLDWASTTQGMSHQCCSCTAVSQQQPHVLNEWSPSCYLTQ